MNEPEGTAWNTSHPVTVQMLLDIAEAMQTEPSAYYGGQNAWSISSQAAAGRAILRVCNRYLGRPEQ